jgi:hypothetical protein
MFPVLNVLAALPCRLIATGALAAVLFAGGCQFGANRVTAKWDVEKAATAQVVAKNAEHVAAVAVQQSTINQEISNDFQKAKAAIAADRQHLLARIPERVRVDAPDSPGPVPAVPGVTARVNAAAADPVPAAEGPATVAACEKLAEDAAQTTLMVVEFQKWYREQRAISTGLNAFISSASPSRTTKSIESGLTGY